jgi:hypothetical protein
MAATTRCGLEILFYIGPGHESWVVGNEPYVSLQFLGAERCGQKHR